MSAQSPMVSQFCVKPTSKRWFFENNPSDHETWSIRCHVGIHIDFTFIILHSHTRSVDPSSVVWSSELRPAAPFPLTTRMLEVYLMVTGSRSRGVKWPLMHHWDVANLYKPSYKLWMRRRAMNEKAVPMMNACGVTLGELGEHIGNTAWQEYIKCPARDSNLSYILYPSAQTFSYNLIWSSRAMIRDIFGHNRLRS